MDRWKLENDGERVFVVGQFDSEEGVDRLIKALEIQRPLLGHADRPDEEWPLRSNDAVLLPERKMSRG